MTFQVSKKVDDLPPQLKVQFNDLLDFMLNVRNNQPTYVRQVHFRVIKLFLWMHDEKGYNSVADFTSNDYLDWVQSHGDAKAGTIRLNVDAVRKVADWAFHKNIGSADTVQRLAMVKSSSRHWQEAGFPASQHLAGRAPAELAELGRCPFNGC